MKWGYIRHIWDFGDTIEIEEKHTGRYGAKGQKREKREKPSPEDIKRQNQWKRKRDVRRIIKWNFGKNDHWITLTYPKGHRPPVKEITGDIQRMIRKVRKQYRKLGEELKYIYRIGIGSKGGRHIHILVNRIFSKETGTDIIIKEAWEKDKGKGHANFRLLYEEGGYQRLAEYITKELQEWEPEDMKRYHCSRNLTRKEPEEKEIRRRNLVDKQGHPIYPKAKKGYYVDPDSVKIGKNPVTGFYYRHYTLVKLDRRI